MSKSIVQRLSDGSVSVLSQTWEKYRHYQYLRVYMTAWGDGKTTSVLQGYNGKKWVRVKAKAGIKA